MQTSGQNLNYQAKLSFMLETHKSSKLFKEKCKDTGVSLLNNNALKENRYDSQNFSLMKTYILPICVNCSLSC